MKMGPGLVDIKQEKSPMKPVDEDTINKAVNEIMSNTNSFRIVSEKYQVPKTLLWRRAKKMGYIKGEKPKDGARIEAIEEIKRGESLISLSRKYNIPISTLHREKLKLYEKGQLPDNVVLKNRSRGEDYDERLRVAIAEILNGKSQNEIAKKHNIPKTTIWRILKKLDPLEYKPNNEFITPQSEIVTQLLQLSKQRALYMKQHDKSDFQNESFMSDSSVINSKPYFEHMDEDQFETPTTEIADHLLQLSQKRPVKQESVSEKPSVVAETTTKSSST